jgi:hypothetical protein
MSDTGITWGEFLGGLAVACLPLYIAAAIKTREWWDRRTAKLPQPLEPAQEVAQDPITLSAFVRLLQCQLDTLEVAPPWSLSLDDDGNAMVSHWVDEDLVPFGVFTDLGNASTVVELINALPGIIHRLVDQETEIAKWKYHHDCMVANYAYHRDKSYERKAVLERINKDPIRHFLRDIEKALRD